MPKPKSVTINLTTKQRAQLKSILGEEHVAVKFEGAKDAVAAMTAPRRLNTRAPSRLASRAPSRVASRRASRSNKF